MPSNKIPSHGLFIRYGKFEAAAYGRWAVIGLLIVIILAGTIALRHFGFG